MDSQGREDEGKRSNGGKEERKKKGRIDGQGREDEVVDKGKRKGRKVEREINK